MGLAPGAVVPATTAPPLDAEYHPLTHPHRPLSSLPCALGGSLRRTTLMGSVVSGSW